MFPHRKGRFGIFPSGFRKVRHQNFVSLYA
jgi:hypothetical protein